ncbi:hypothetical protein G7Y79_00026g059600 [Physcia stellaris]|nr:hypothetical protein G7Y79_00026g059600 [Physcia stellaris]
MTSLQTTHQTLHLATIIGFAFVGGISTCLSIWIMPLLQHASPLARIAQFNSTVHKGGQYLQPSSRVLSACLLTLTVLEYLADGWGARCWAYACTLLVVLPVAPYEVCCIFWINDRVAEVGRELKAGNEIKEKGDDGSQSAVEEELEELIGMWRRRNWGRAGPALAAGVAVAIIGSPLLGS